MFKFTLFDFVLHYNVAQVYDARQTRHSILTEDLEGRSAAPVYMANFFRVNFLFNSKTVQKIKKKVSIARLDPGYPENRYTNPRVSISMPRAIGWVTNHHAVTANHQEDEL